CDAGTDGRYLEEVFINQRQFPKSVGMKKVGRSMATRAFWRLAPPRHVRQVGCGIGLSYPRSVRARAPQTYGWHAGRWLAFMLAFVRVAWIAPHTKLSIDGSQ